MDWTREDLENKSKEEIDCLYENECDDYKE